MPAPEDERGKQTKGGATRPAPTRPPPDSAAAGKATVGVSAAALQAGRASVTGPAPATGQASVEAGTVDGQMDSGWVNGQMDEQMDRWVIEDNLYRFHMCSWGLQWEVFHPVTGMFNIMGWGTMPSCTWIHGHKSP